MTGDLSADDFPAFFRDLHARDDGCGPCPFPWQRRLVSQIAETGVWPSLLDLPTGSGKTAALDAAVFVLALRGDQPRRIVFVVDRRIVVHQAAQRARHVAARLREASTGVLAEVAQRLRAIAATGGAGDEPLRYAELRGGIQRDESWARRPDVPTVVVSTVDQVGSRLLFRGYGVSDEMRPVHAGLLGNDVLYLLDEVHLARPFAQSLAAIGRRYRPPAQADLPERWSVVELSATPGEWHHEDPFRLDDEDRDPAAAPVLARRLAASKPACPELVRVSGSNAARHREALATAAVGHVGRLLTQPGIRTLGVIVNRVDTAGRVRRRMETEHPDVDCLVLTGRMRPLERDRILAEYEGRLHTGRVRRDDDLPLVVIATQAVEAGADLDLDAVVTECAALDALIQRLGRVDRAGDLAASGRQTESVILATTADVGATSEDPVYGTALRDTWAWLQQRQLDFGPDAFTITATERIALSTRSTAAPQLLPSHLDRWVQPRTPTRTRRTGCMVWLPAVLKSAWCGEPISCSGPSTAIRTWPGTGFERSSHGARLGAERRFSFRSRPCVPGSPASGPARRTPSPTRSTPRMPTIGSTPSPLHARWTGAETTAVWW